MFRLFPIFCLVALWSSSTLCTTPQFPKRPTQPLEHLNCHVILGSLTAGDGVVQIRWNPEVETSRLHQSEEKIGNKTNYLVAKSALAYGAVLVYYTLNQETPARPSGRIVFQNFQIFSDVSEAFFTAKDGPVEFIIEPKDLVSDKESKRAGSLLLYLAKHFNWRTGFRVGLPAARWDGSDFDAPLSEVLPCIKKEREVSMQEFLNQVTNNGQPLKGLSRLIHAYEGEFFRGVRYWILRMKRTYPYFKSGRDVYGVEIQLKSGYSITYLFGELETDSKAEDKSSDVPLFTSPELAPRFQIRRVNASPAK